MRTRVCVGANTYRARVAHCDNVIRSAAYSASIKDKRAYPFPDQVRTV